MHHREGLKSAEIHTRTSQWLVEHEQANAGRGRPPGRARRPARQLPHLHFDVFDVVPPLSLPPSCPLERASQRMCMCKTGESWRGGRGCIVFSSPPTVGGERRRDGGGRGCNHSYAARPGRGARKASLRYLSFRVSSCASSHGQPCKCSTRCRLHKENTISCMHAGIIQGSNPPNRVSQCQEEASCCCYHPAPEVRCTPRDSSCLKRQTGMGTSLNIQSGAS
jgi:hypothetical protein